VTEAITAAVITLGVANTKQELGITYRQLDWWTRLGLLRPLHVGGSGVNREWTRAELEVARLMGHLVRAGATPALAERLARSRRCELSPGIWIEVTA
jgi:DNA-binding transcriptional MerR regulator